ncbi:hypothetical protein HMPREF9141_1678 [Prevotella multiformis DSM 16608]|uniref:Uncharacterized protein n=1 Tax=Prevotella multiformis DSM 16608 TaxID=888743 RepID=F0F7W1_9BACT|nr:hypothetical protein HMPREF9141_1678 [Prevotella multiformis DSM 16608]
MWCGKIFVSLHLENERKRLWAKIKAIVDDFGLSAMSFCFHGIYNNII